VAALAVRLSKIFDYLADIIYVCMLSRVMKRIQVESELAGDRFPNREIESSGRRGLRKISTRIFPEK
jgi:hypothetical protein